METHLVIMDYQFHMMELSQLIQIVEFHSVVLDFKILKFHFPARLTKILQNKSDKSYLKWKFNM